VLPQPPQDCPSARTTDNAAVASHLFHGHQRWLLVQGAGIVRFAIFLVQSTAKMWVLQHEIKAAPPGEGRAEYTNR
jgi:hypothetical protein